MIELNNVKVDYGQFVLDIDRLALKPGQITGLVGTNGSGKTTTFKLIAGLLKADQGRALTLGMDAWQLTPALKQEIGTVFSDSQPDELFQLRDIRRVLKAFYPDFDGAQFDALCEKFELPSDKAVSAYSTGMKAKLNIICALSHHPRLLVLDEVTSGLDILARTEILELLQDFMEQPDRAIVISSHIASDLETVCDDFYMIHDGKIILHEEVDRLLDEYGVLVLSDRQKEQMDSSAVIAWMKSPSGWKVLVSDRRFYEENEPDFVIEKGNLDDLIMILEKGEKR